MLSTLLFLTRCQITAAHPCLVNVIGKICAFRTPRIPALLIIKILTGKCERRNVVEMICVKLD